MKSFLCICVLAAASLYVTPVFPQKLVDPSKVAPEFREAAAKRRAEQLRERECSLKADMAKTMPRDRTEFINHCIEAAIEKK